MGEVSFVDVSKRFSMRVDGELHHVQALERVSFTVRDGEMVALIGPSGCGKTTALRVAMGLDPASGGRVTVDGREVKGCGYDRGMVFQHAELLPWLSARQNVMFGLEMKGMRGGALRETAEKYLELVGLTASGNRRPHQLSGGMKQRVGIARALAIDPKVLLMDEPFGALDAQTRETMQAELLDIHARTGKTILFVTHDLDEAVLIADRIVVMKDGRVQGIMNVPLGRPRPDLGLVRGMPEFADTRYKVWRALHDERRCIDNGPKPHHTPFVPAQAGTQFFSVALGPRLRGDERLRFVMADIADTRKQVAPPAEPAERRPLPRWVITVISVCCALILWEIFGRNINPIFGSYPSAIAVAFWELLVTGQLGTALYSSLRPFAAGYGLAIVIGVPLGLVIGRFRVAEAALGIYITAGYAMPLVALVPLLMLWLGLGFAVKVAVVFLMALFPIVINTWLGVTAVPKTLIEVGKSFVASDIVILRRIVLPATLPYIMAGIRLAVGRAVVAMVIAEFFTTISGLGAVIINSANNFDTATMFVPIIILMVMAIGLNGVIGWVERKVAPWQAEIAGRERE